MARKKSQQPNVGAWLGGNRGYLQSGSNTDTTAKADAGGGQMEQVRAELGLGAYVAGVGATAAIGAGIAASVGAARVAGKAVQSGRVVNPVAAARNIISGERVVLHGSPKSGLPVLKPSTGSKTLPDQSVLFSWNPRKPNMSNVIHSKAVRYANKFEDAGSIYVAKVPKNVTVRHPKKSVRDSKNMLVTRGEGKVVAEVPLGKQYSELSRAEKTDIANRVQAELRKAGVQPRGMPKALDSALGKVDDALWRAEYKVKRKIRQTFLTPAQQAQRAAARRRSIR